MKYSFVLFVLIVSSCAQNILPPTELVGNWGNEKDNTNLSIGTQRALFDFTCGSAEINTDFTKENRASFNVEGTYMQQFGNIPEDYDPAKYTYAAIFKFTRNLDVLKVEITKVADSSNLGIFTYTKGENVMVKKCP